ncbi:MAG: FG-GAP repeat protein [Pelosinus sp.]|nr:FG-GAP repeat protein [Pelosinus sp.]
MSNLVQITASDRALEDFFGGSVEISGDTAIVGASGRNANTGAAYIYVRNGTTWTQQAELIANNGVSGDLFGISVAISGDIVIVGASGKNAMSGAAYIYVRSGTSWIQQAELTVSDAFYNSFGSSVAISSNTAIVGASSGNANTGAAYIYVRNGTIWTEQAELTASEGVSNDQFGYSVAISGDTAIIGFANEEKVGKAYIYTRSGTTWTEQAKLTASGGALGDWFGAAVAISGDTAIIGFANEEKVGKAYIYTRSGTTWTEQAKLTARDGALGDWFGAAVAISGDTAIVGAYAKNSYTGAAYIYVRNGTIWTQQAEIVTSDGTSDDAFGAAVAISGDTTIFGNHGKNSYTGAAYISSRSTPPSSGIKLDGSLDF